MFRLLLISILLFSALTVSAQNVEKMLEEAQKVFYTEDFVEAGKKFQEVLAVSPKENMAIYHGLICKFLTDGRGEPMDELIDLGYGKRDKFYHYWLGRIYFGNYEAQLAMKHFKMFLETKASKSSEIIEETKKFYKDAEFLLQYLTNPDDYEIRLVPGINSDADDLSPVFFKGNDELLFFSSRPNKDGNGAYRVFHSKYGVDEWDKATELSALGDFEFENANLEVVNEDGKLFVFDRRKGGRLFFSEQKNNAWTAPTEFDDALSSAHIQSHFFINPKENRVIFASNDGKKNKDFELMESTKNPATGKWSDPLPLNGDVNSTYNELSPYLSLDEKTLYFSSDRPGFMGGFDIFSSTYDEASKSWSAPTNVGFPINSPDNEINFKMNESGEEGYFSSDRIHGMGGFDIYYFWEIEKVNITGSILAAKNNEPLPNHQIKFHPSSYYDESFTSTSNEDGRFGNEIIADEIFVVEIFDEDDKMVYTNSLQVKAIGGLSTTLVKSFIVGGDNGDEMLFLTNIEDEEDEEQTQDYLIASKEKAVTPEAAEVAAETMADSLPVVEESTESDKSSVATTTPAVSKQTAAVATSKRYEEVIRKLIRPNVYYTTTRTYYSSEYQKLLDEALKLMREDETIVVEVAGHTDNFGSKQVNMVISEKRAEAVKEYLVGRGISPKRIIAKGYGDTKPMASNDQEAEGRELNRRVEFLVVAEGK